MTSSEEGGEFRPDAGASGESGQPVGPTLSAPSPKDHSSDPPIEPPDDLDPARRSDDGGSGETLLEGYLHPGVLFLSLLNALRGAVVMASIALFAKQWSFAFFAIGLFVVVMLAELARYLTFRYRLTTEELITTHGILHRQERRIPINRIQDLSFESTIIRRLLRLVVVSVETASGAGAEAELDSLSREDGEALREALHRARSQKLGGREADDSVADPNGAMPAVVRQPVPERLLYLATSGQLTLLGLTNNRIGVLLAAAFGVWELASQVGIDLGGWIGYVLLILSELHWSLLAVVVVVLLFLGLLGGWIVSIIANQVMFHRFTLTLRDDVCQRRYGLLTTRSATLPRKKIQRVLFESRMLRWLIGYAVVRADSAGSGTREETNEGGGRDVVAPLVPVPHAEALASVLLPGFHPDRVPWRRVSERVIARVLVQGIVLTTVAAPLLIWWFGVLGGLALFIIPLSYGVGALSFANLAYSRHPEHLVLRWGILGRYRAIIPLRKLQGVVVREPLVDRIFRLAELTVYVAGGSPSRLRFLPVETARALQADVGRFAARSKFIW